MKKKYIFIGGGILLILAMIFYGLLKFMNLRNFQVFGELIYHVNTEQKVIALTFDDAPTLQTNAVLKILADKNIKATFFEIGQEIEKHPEETQAILASGMEVGNHSYSHSRMVLKPFSFYQQEIEKTNALILGSGYKGLIYFRPPYGKKLFGLPWYLNQHNIKTIMWDIEPDTYLKENENNSNSQMLVDYVLEQTKPGSIILLHPFCEQECLVDREALPKIIDGLQAKGYVFVTVSQLLTYENK